MGQIIGIETVSGKHIVVNPGSSRFKNHIILNWGSEFVPHSSFLSEIQIDTLTPDFDLDKESIVQLQDANVLGLLFVLNNDYKALFSNDYLIGGVTVLSLYFILGKSLVKFYGKQKEGEK